MPTIKLGSEVSIASEKLGFPASVTPTPEQVGQKVAELVEDLGKMESDRNAWREKAETAQAKVRQYKGAEEKVKELECDSYLEKAVRAFKLDKAMVPHLKEMWKSDEKNVRKMIDGLRTNAYLAAEVGLSGDAAPSDPIDQVKVLAMEKMANNKELSEGDASLAVLRENPSLSAQYRAAMLGTKEGA